MPLARLEIEIDNGCDLRVRVEDRLGCVSPWATGTEAWSVFYRLFPQKTILEGTLEDIRKQYLQQCAEQGLTREETAERLGVSYRSLRSWTKDIQDITFETRSREKHTAETREIALRLLAEDGPTRTAAMTGVSVSTLRRWRLEEEGATVTLAPHAHEAYEDAALRQDDIAA